MFKVRLFILTKNEQMKKSLRGFFLEQRFSCSIEHIHKYSIKSHCLLDIDGAIRKNRTGHKKVLLDVHIKVNLQ